MFLDGNFIWCKEILPKKRSQNIQFKFNWCVFSCGLFCNFCSF